MQHMDTQSTVPWVGTEMDSPEGACTLVLADLLELGKDELGKNLFLDSLKLGPGAMCFREFVLNAFADEEMVLLSDAASEAKGLDKLQHVYRVTVELVKDAKDKVGVWEHFIAEGYNKVKASAELSVAKVKDMAAKEPDQSKAKKTQAKADMWLTKEVAALDKRREELSSAATKAASLAAGKVHALISHLRSTDLLSQSFAEQMEFWSQLDSTDAAARLARRVPGDRPDPVKLFRTGAAAGKSGALSPVPEQKLQDSGPQVEETLVDSAPEAVVSESTQSSAPDLEHQDSAESLEDSAPDHEHQDSGPQESLADLIPEQEELQDSGPPLSVADLVPEHKELQDSGPRESVADLIPEQEELQDSGPRESVADLVPEQNELQDSGPRESVADLVPEQKELQDSGPRESVADLVPEQKELQDSGPRESVADLTPEQELQDSGPQQESSDMLLRAETQGSLTNSEFQLRQEFLGPRVSRRDSDDVSMAGLGSAMLRSLNTDELLQAIADPEPSRLHAEKPDVSGPTEATKEPAEIAGATKVHCSRF